MLAVLETQYYNGMKYEHSTTIESFAGKLSLCYNRETETHNTVRYNIVLKYSTNA